MKEDDCDSGVPTANKIAPAGVSVSGESFPGNLLGKGGEEAGRAASRDSLPGIPNPRTKRRELRARDSARSIPSRSNGCTRHLPALPVSGASNSIKQKLPAFPLYYCSHLFPYNSAPIALSAPRRLRICRLPHALSPRSCSSHLLCIWWHRVLLLTVPFSVLCLHDTSWRRLLASWGCANCSASRPTHASKRALRKTPVY